MMCDLRSPDYNKLSVCYTRARMSVPTSRTLESVEGGDRLARLGGWLFKRRTSIPVPIATALLLVSPDWSTLSLSTSLALVGVPIVAMGELLRLWGVHHIGVISRTRSERLGPLIDSGPFASCVAIFESKKDDARVIALLNLLGRKVSVVLPIGAVAPVT